MIPTISTIPASVPTYVATVVPEYVPTVWSTVPSIGMVATTPFIATTAVPTVAYVLSTEDRADLDRRIREAARIMANGAIRAAMAARVATVSYVPTVTYVDSSTLQ